MTEQHKTNLAVIGAGPGGYAAAFYAADKGMNVTLIEKDSVLGGVCLNRGCIPSKALLHAAQILDEAAHAEEWGISFGQPELNVDRLREMKNSIVEKLNKGISMLAKQRKVTVLNGEARFKNTSTLTVSSESGVTEVVFTNCIIATGSLPALPSMFDVDPERVMTSTEALSMDRIPESLLVVGGGIIGMELGSVYASLGSEVTVVEAMDKIIPGADPDLVRPFTRVNRNKFKTILLNARVTGMTKAANGIDVTVEAKGKTITETFDKVLVSIGRTPGSKNLGLENTSIKLDAAGYIKTNETLETNEPGIYAIGDIAGGVLLAHKASKEARIAVDHLAKSPQEDTKNSFVIPSVVYTDPEIAWVGLTEEEAKQNGQTIKVTKFPWSACGKSLSQNRNEGTTKLITDPNTDKILGVGIVGPKAGDLISEGALAVASGMTADAVGNVVHPHPTLSETVMEAAHAVHGTCSHIYVPKRMQKVN